MQKRTDTPSGPDNVIRMRSNPGEGEVNGRALSAFVDYWGGLRAGGDVPRRSEIDPRRIDTLLPNAFIAERVTPGLARLRIAGMLLSDLMGMEVRGMPLSAFVVPAHRDRLADALVRLFDEPATLRLDLAAPGGIGAPPLTGTLLLLPLRSDLGDISRALGCLVTEEGETGRAPRRFEITASHIRGLEPAPSAQASDPGTVRPAASEFAEGTTAFDHSGPRAHLRLVTSRD